MPDPPLRLEPFRRGPSPNWAIFWIGVLVGATIEALVWIFWRVL